MMRLGIFSGAFLMQIFINGGAYVKTMRNKKSHFIFMSVNIRCA